MKLSENLVDLLYKIIKKILKNEKSEFVRDSIALLYYHLHKIDLKRDRWYIDSPEWLKNKKSTINPKNYDDNCFQYALTVALNHQNIRKSPQRISKVKPFIDQYNWKHIDPQSHSKDWKKVEQNNNTIALKILFVPHNTKKNKTCIKIKTLFYMWKWSNFVNDYWW